MHTEVKPTNSAPNNNNNNNQSRNNSGCFVCERTGHVSRNCRSPPSNNNNNNDSRINNGFQNNEEIRSMEKSMQLLKRPTYVLNILYNNFGIYLSKRLQKNKTMYNLWQVAGGKVENRESFLQAVLRETKEEIALDIKKDECIFLFNDPAFNCDVYLTKIPDHQELQ
ncbi:hypothetical protein C1646_761542 [Rhizophagus diaphanus]|nr:hypothetical protein C1646_761542 [Rhizophagus diaphanus] [Rhizophagus sp. MUCL 43196]